MERLFLPTDVVCNVHDFSFFHVRCRALPFLVDPMRRLVSTSQTKKYNVYNWGMDINNIVHAVYTICKIKGYIS